MLPEVSYIASFLLIPLILRELRRTYRNLGIATSRLPYCFSRRFPIRCTDLNWYHEVLCDYGVSLMSSAVRLWFRSACGRAVVSCYCFIFIAVVIDFRAREFFFVCSIVFSKGTEQAIHVRPYESCYMALVDSLRVC